MALRWYPSPDESRTALRAQDALGRFFEVEPEVPNYDRDGELEAVVLIDGQVTAVLDSERSAKAWAEACSDRGIEAMHQYMSRPDDDRTPFGWDQVEGGAR